MCTTCGCGAGNVTIEGPHAAYRRVDAGKSGWHRHGSVHWHHHPEPDLVAVHAAGVSEARSIAVERDLLAANDAVATRIRARLRAARVLALNLVSSPGSGKTTLLVQTIRALAGRVPIAVIEGDQQTSRDAERIRATGVAAVQINTGKGCHLDASMVEQALFRMNLPSDGLLLIENVGNLVCPAAFDLGEAHKVVILSVTEGDDKPLKYPDMFAAADLCLISKLDLLPYVSFDVTAAIEHARRMRPGIEALALSATTGEGMDAWLGWIDHALIDARTNTERGTQAPVHAASTP